MKKIMNTSLIYFVLAMAGGVFTVNLQNGMVIQSRQLWGIVQVLSIDLGENGKWNAVRLRRLSHIGMMVALLMLLIAVKREMLGE